MTDDQIPNNQLDILIKKVYSEMINRVVTDVNENYLYQIWKRDAQTPPNGEYAYPEEDTSGAVYVPGMKKLKTIWVRHKNGEDSAGDPVYTEYRECQEIDIDTIGAGPERVRRWRVDWEKYLEDLPAYSPIYYVADRSIFIAPQFTTDTLGQPGNLQLKLEGIETVAELDDTVQEADIRIEKEYHWIMAIGLEGEIKRTRLKLGEKNDALNEYNYHLDEMVRYMSNRTIAPVFADVPRDRSIEY